MVSSRTPIYAMFLFRSRAGNAAASTSFRTLCLNPKPYALKPKPETLMPATAFPEEKMKDVVSRARQAANLTVEMPSSVIPAKRPSARHRTTSCLHLRESGCSRLNRAFQGAIWDPGNLGPWVAVRMPGSPRPVTVKAVEKLGR